MIVCCSVNGLKSKKFNYIKYMPRNIDDIKYILHFPRYIYDILAIIKEWDFDPDITFKVINPGEQMTNTFNKIVLNDNNEWYKGKFYKI